MHKDFFITELEGIRKFGGKYSILKDKNGAIKLVQEIPAGSKLNPSFQLVEPNYETSGSVPWNFAPKVISQLKEEQNE
jgi:hypothetical protein